MITRSAPLFLPEIYDRARHQNIEDLKKDLLKSNFLLLQAYAIPFLISVLIANIVSLKDGSVWITFVEAAFATGLTRYFANKKPIKGQFVLLYGSINWVSIVAAGVAFNDHPAQWALSVIFILLTNVFLLQRLLLESNAFLAGIMLLYFFESLLFSGEDARSTLVAICVVPEIILLFIRMYMWSGIRKNNNQSPQSFNFLQGSTNKQAPHSTDPDGSHRENKLDVSLENPNKDLQVKQPVIQKKLNFEEDGFEIKSKEKDDLGVIDNIYGGDNEPSPSKKKQASPPQNNYNIPKFEPGSANTDDEPRNDYQVPVFNPNIQITEEEIPNPFEKLKKQAQKRVQSEADDDSLADEDIFPKLKQAALEKIVNQNQPQSGEQNLPGFGDANVISPQEVQPVVQHFPDKIPDDKPFLAEHLDDSGHEDHDGAVPDVFGDIYGESKKPEDGQKKVNLFEDFPNAHAFDQVHEAGGGNVETAQMPDNMKKNAAPFSDDHEILFEKQASDDEQEVVKSTKNPFAKHANPVTVQEKSVENKPVSIEIQEEPKYEALDELVIPVQEEAQVEEEVKPEEGGESQNDNEVRLEISAPETLSEEKPAVVEEEKPKVVEEKPKVVEKVEEKKNEFDQHEERAEHRELKDFLKSTLVFSMQGVFDQENKRNQEYIHLLEKCLEYNDSDLTTKRLRPEVISKLEKDNIEISKLLVKYYDPSKLQFKNGTFDTRYASTSKYVKFLKRSGLNFEETLKKIMPAPKPEESKKSDKDVTPNKQTAQARTSVEGRSSTPEKITPITPEKRLSTGTTISHQKSAPVEDVQKPQTLTKSNTMKPEAPKKVNLEALVSFDTPDDKKKAQPSTSQQANQEPPKQMPVFSPQEMALLANPKTQSSPPEVKSKPLSDPKIDYGAFFTTTNNEKTSPGNPTKEVDQFAEEIFSSEDNSSPSQPRKSINQEELRKRASKLLDSQKINNLFAPDREEVLEPEMIKEEDDDDVEGYYTLGSGAKIMKSDDFPFDLKPDDPAMAKLKDQIRRFNKLKLEFDNKGHLDMSKKPCKEYMKLVVRTREDPDLYVLKAKQELQDMLRYFDKSKLKFKSDGNFDMKNKGNKDFVKLCQLCGETLEDQLKLSNRK